MKSSKYTFIIVLVIIAQVIPKIIIVVLSIPLCLGEIGVFGLSRTIQNFAYGLNRKYTACKTTKSTRKLKNNYV